MGDLTTAMARAADTLSESLAAPRTTGSQTRYGTVVANNGSTLDVAMAGGTIAGVPMTTACCSAVAGDRVLLDVTGPLVTATGILANSGNGPYVLLYNRTSQPDTAPVSISGTGNLNEFARLKVYGCTGEWRRSYCEVFKNADGTYHNARFTLSAYNGYSYDAYVKMTDFRVDVANASAWSMVPQSYNEISAHQSSTFTNTFIGSSIVRVVGVREPWLA